MSTFVAAFYSLWDLINKGGVVVLLIIDVAALWKGWVVRSSEYDKVVRQHERLLLDNALLRETLATVTQGVAHPIQKTLEAIPTPDEGAHSP